MLSGLSNVMRLTCVSNHYGINWQIVTVEISGKRSKGVSNAKMPLPTSIEGVTGESNIAGVWRDHYNSVFNSTDGGCYTPNFSKYNDVY